MNDHDVFMLIAKVTSLETQMNHLQDTLVPKVEKLEALTIKHHRALQKLGPFCDILKTQVLTLKDDVANIRIAVPDLPPLDDEKMPPWEDYVKVKEEKVEPMR